MAIKVDGFTLTTRLEIKATGGRGGECPRGLTGTSGVKEEDKYNKVPNTESEAPCSNTTASRQKKKERGGRTGKKEKDINCDKHWQIEHALRNTHGISG